MLVATLEITLYAPWVHSLKEKRMEVKNLTAKIRNKFDVSVAETAGQDTHQTIGRLTSIPSVASQRGRPEYFV